MHSQTQLLNGIHFQSYSKLGQITFEDITGAVFYGPDALPVAKPMVSKQLKKFKPLAPKHMNHPLLDLS